MQTNNISNGYIQQLVGKREKVCFSSGSESRDIIRRADVMTKRVPIRRGGVCEMPLTIGYCIVGLPANAKHRRTWKSGTYEMF